MKAAIITRFGGAEVIELIDLPTPSPGPGQLLIKVLATMVHRLDHYIRQGDIHTSLPLAHIIGTDAVGEVAERGCGALKHELGDRVLVMPGYPANPAEYGIRPATAAPSFTLLGQDAPGTYAQYVVVPEAWVIADTSGLPPEEAAALPLTLLTAIRAVQTVGEVKAGDRVLIHAGACGAGPMCIQVAKSLGARVATTVRSTAAASTARRLGTDKVINTHEEDFAEAIQQWTHGEGVDVAIDCLGGPDFQRTLDAVRAFGIVVAMGVMAGSEVSFDVQRFFRAQKQIRGTLMADIEDLETWMHRVRAGQIRPVLDTVLPLSEAALAHQLVAANKAQGGVVLLPWCH